MKVQPLILALLFAATSPSVNADWLIKTYRNGSPVTGLADADALISGGFVIAATNMAEGDMVGFSTGEGTGHFAINNPVPGIPNNVATDNYAVQGTGFLIVPVTAQYTFGLNTDDGARLRIDGADVIVDNVRSPPHDSPYVTVTLSAGLHGIEWTWYNTAGGVNGGGAEGEICAALGVHTGFDASFQLVGSEPGLVVISGGSGDFVDPNPSLLDANGNVVTAVNQLATGGRIIGGVVADGVTRVLLRLQSNVPVTISLTSGSYVDGSLIQLGIVGPGTTSVTVTPQSSGGTNWVFALYTPPLDFSSSPTNINSRTIQFQVIAGSSTNSASLQLVRPPVVLVHGVWSDPTSAWSSMTNFFQQQGITVCPQCLVNYGSDPDNSAPSFDPYAQSPAIDQLILTTSNALSAIRATGVAATQVDVIGHSMGGLVARARVRYTSDPTGGYYRPANFHGGDFHKIITVGTPHLGSKLADWLIQHQNDTFPRYGTVGSFLAANNKPLGPAIQQFETTSGALVNIGDTDVPAHAIVGVAPSNSTTESLLDFILLLSNNGFTTIRCLLGGDYAHDTIVPISSEEGALGGSATSSVAGVVHADFSDFGQLVHRGGQHDVGETASTDVWNQVIQYLEAPILNSGSFGYFRALSNGGYAPPYARCQTTSQTTSASLISSGGKAQSALSATVTLTPTAGTVVKPGDTVQVNFSIVGGNAVTGALFAVASGLLEIDGGGPFSFSFTVASNAVGTINISAFSFGSGLTNYSASTYVTVQPSGSLTTISVSPATLNFSLFGQAQGLSVAGNYGDGVQRNVTTAGAGTTYVTQSGSNAVVNVSSNGLVTANGNGQDTIIISNSGLATSVIAKVQISNYPPIPAPISNQTFVAGTLLNIPIQFTDPDGNAITLSAPSLPPFATLIDYGNGNGLLQIAPSASTMGTFYVTVVADNNGTPPLGAAVSFFLTISPPPPLQILSIQRQGNNMLLTWSTPGGTNFVQATNSGPGGTYSNNFVDIPASLTFIPESGGITNYLDVGGATNQPARYYRIRLVPFTNGDSVGDGIADLWRQSYFGGSGTTTNSRSCATCDADGTGQNNLFKYVAGLDPTNPASVFVLNVASVTNQPHAMSLNFNPLALGRTYTPLFSTSLVSGVWLPLTTYTGLLTNGNQVTITDTNPIPPQEFYRIDISLP